MAITWFRKPTKRRPAPGRARPHSFRPRLEALEDRLTPAIHTWTGAVNSNWSVPGNWTNGTPTSVQGTFMFGEPGNGVQAGKPAKLTYYGWVTLQHQVEFEFRDLPLP